MDALGLIDYLHLQSRCTFKPLVSLLCPRVGKSRCWSLSDIPGCCIRDGVSIVTMSLSLLPFSVWSFYICCAEVIQSAFNSSGGIAFFIGLNFMCIWEEVSSGLCCHLETNNTWFYNNNDDSVWDLHLGSLTPESVVFIISDYYFFIILTLTFFKLDLWNYHKLSENSFFFLRTIFISFCFRQT